jgi:hypothetical protein
MKSLSDSDKAAAEHAANTLRDIEFLTDCREFKSFMSGFKARADQMAEAILHDNELSPVEREALRRERLGVLEVMQAPALIRQGATSVLRSHGIG